MKITSLKENPIHYRVTKHPSHGRLKVLGKFKCPNTGRVLNYVLGWNMDGRSYRLDLDPNEMIELKKEIDRMVGLIED